MEDVVVDPKIAQTADRRQLPVVCSPYAQTDVGITVPEEVSAKKSNGKMQ